MVQAAFKSLSNDEGLHQLLPYFTQFIAEEVMPRDSAVAQQPASASSHVFVLSGDIQPQGPAAAEIADAYGALPARLAAPAHRTLRARTRSCFCTPLHMKAHHGRAVLAVAPAAAVDSDVRGRQAPVQSALGGPLVAARFCRVTRRAGLQHVRPFLALVFCGYPVCCVVTIVLNALRDAGTGTRTTPCKCASQRSHPSFFQLRLHLVSHPVCPHLADLGEGFPGSEQTAHHSLRRNCWPVEVGHCPSSCILRSADLFRAVGSLGTPVTQALLLPHIRVYLQLLGTSVNHLVSSGLTVCLHRLGDEADAEPGEAG